MNTPNDSKVLILEDIARELHRKLGTECHAVDGRSIAFRSCVTVLEISLMQTLAGPHGLKMWGVRKYVGRSKAFDLVVDF
jgi:hypothetical protein